MSSYELIVLGDLALRSADTGHLIGATRRKPLAVLALLHVAGQSVDRDWLAQLLWPGDVRRARHSLAQTLYALNAELGQPVAESNANRLVANRLLIDSDWSKFNADLAAGQIEAAVKTYGGPFLDGVHFRDCADFERWSDALREQLAATHRSALTPVAEAAVARRNPAEGRKPRRRVLMAALVGAAAAVAAFALFPRHHRPASMFDELFARHNQLIAGRAVSGRVFIETPVLQTPGPVGDSLVRLIDTHLMEAVETFGAARLVPRDSVVAVEAAASREAINSPVQRLARTDARIGVMTVVSVKDDSVHVQIAVQRLAPPVKVVGHQIESADRLPPKFSGSPTVPFGWNQASIETRQLTSFTAPIAAGSDAMGRMELALVSALATMRSCDARAHTTQHALPWCWERDNVPVVVEGFWRAQSARIAMDNNADDRRRP